jgi:[protein-PII] uridylyltransferase
MALSDFAARFRDTMPSAYANAFSDADIEEHALIVQGSAAGAPCALVWRTLPQGMAILCVVAEDRPGLVALVSAAFVAHALDVRSAQIYCRTLPGARLEAVDFFWLRNIPGGLPEAERLDACRRTILALLGSGAATAISDSAAAARHDLGEAGAQDTGANVSYGPDASAPEHWEISLQARDFPGLLHTVARLLHQHGLEVLRCEIRTEEGVAHDRFQVACFTGVPAQPQLEAFRAALLGVMNAVGQG